MKTEHDPELIPKKIVWEQKKKCCPKTTNMIQHDDEYEQIYAPTVSGACRDLGATELWSLGLLYSGLGIQQVWIDPNQNLTYHPKHPKTVDL